MTRNEKNERRRYRGLNLFTGVLLGMYLVISGYLIYNLYKLTGIETLIRYIVMGVLALIAFVFVIRYFRLRHRPSLKKIIVTIFLLLIFGGLQFFVAYTLNKGLDVVDNISTQKYKTYKTSLIAMNGKLSSKADIKDSTKIGRVKDEEDIENYVLTKEIMSKDNIKESQIIDYEDPITLLYELYEGKMDAAFISGSYVDIYKTMQKFENIDKEVVELDSFSKKMKVQKDKATQASTKSITEPFTILLMGVDSTSEQITQTSGLGDSLVVITFNPETLNATILSIPRDTFVPISCYRNVNSKITHAASGGDSCMIKTIQNFLDVKIDYYAKINFRGLIKIVDALGGIDVDVPYAFCETDETRSSKNMITVEKGWQHLDGRQALALSRNRKTIDWCGKHYNQGTRNDFVRGQNQQLVINGIVNKAKTLRSVDQFYSLLDAVGGSMTTNMDRKQILSFYNLFKKILASSSDLQDGNNILDMQRLYINGRGALIQDGIMSSMNLYEYVPSSQSVAAVKKAMKENLGIVNATPAKEFSFSADKGYEKKVIGKDLYGGIPSYPTVPEKKTEETTDNPCTGDNEELGADKKTCVCKNGYTKEDGKCVKKEAKAECTGANEVLDSTGSTCVCKSGYEKVDGVCTKKDSGGGSSGGGESGGGSSSGGESGGGSSSGGESSGGSSSGGSSGGSSSGGESGNTGGTE